MVNNLKLTNQVIKYLVYGLIVYTLFAYVPQKKLPTTDLLLMSGVIIVSFIILDILTPTNYSENSENFDQLYEHLDVDAVNQELSDDIESEDENVESEDENVESEDQSGVSVNYLVSNKPEIIKSLQNKKVIDEDDITELYQICNDRDECSNKFLEMLNNNKINNEELLELNIVFGLGKYNTLQELYLQERLNRDQSLEIAYAISSNSKTLSKGIIQKYLKNNLINTDDHDKLVESLEMTDDNNEGRNYLANMIKNDLINTLNAKIINEKCSSSSMDSCTIQINKFKTDKLINNSQAVSLLKGYNKPGINDIVYDNSDFGSISNEHDVGSINEQTDLGNVNFNDKLLSDDKMIKQSKSIVEGKDNNFNNIDEEIEENKFDLDEFNKRFEMSKANQSEYKQKLNEEYKKYLNIRASKKYNKDHDMKYSIYSNKQTQPLGQFSKDFTNSFDHGFSYLQTDKWSVPEYDNSVCKIDEKCNYCEEDYEGYPVDVSKWNYSRKVLPRDNINIQYIKDKLNTGNI